MRRLTEGGTKHHYQVPLQCYSGHYEDLSVMENVFVGSERGTPVCPLWSCEDRPGNHDLGSDEKMKQNMGT